MNKNQISKFVLLGVFIMIVLGNDMFSQALNYTLNKDYLWGFDNYYNSKAQNFQTFVKPYRYTDIKSISDSTAECPILIGKNEKQPGKEKKSAIEIFPIISAIAGYQSSSSSRFLNDLAIGANLSMNIGEKFALNVKAYTGRATFSSYTDSVIKESHVVPGIGYAYRSNHNRLEIPYTS